MLAVIAAATVMAPMSLPVAAHATIADLTGTPSTASSNDVSKVGAARLTHHLTVSVTGSGTVTDGQKLITCPTTCDADYPSGTEVELTASPGPDHFFDHWDGACDGAGPCSITMDKDAAVGAVFVDEPGTFPISSTSPATGQAVIIDLSSFRHAHGGVTDFLLDLNGDGTLERDLHLASHVVLTYMKPGSRELHSQISFLDGTKFNPSDTITVTGTGMADCGTQVYCHVGFPLPPPGGGGCTSVVMVGVATAQPLDTADCFAESGPVFTIDRPVRVNGIDLFPRTGTTVTFDPDSNTISSDGGLVDVQLGELPLGPATIDWSDLEGSDGDAEVPPIDPTPLASFEGFRVPGHFQTTLHDDATSTEALNVELPDLLGDVAVHIGLRGWMDRGITLDSLHLHLPTGWINGSLPIQNLDIDYDASTNFWGGGLGVSIGGYDVGASVGFQGGNLVNLGASVGGLNVHITDGVFLDSISFDLTQVPPPPTFTGGIGLTYGPKYHDISLVEVDGSFTLVIDVPADIAIDAELDILSLKVANAHIDYRLDGNFALTADVRLVPWWDDPHAAPNPRITGSLSGWVDGPSDTFDIEGGGRACFGVCAGADIVVSSVGAAACIHFIGDVGGGYTYTDRRIHFPIGCDLGRYSLVRPERTLDVRGFSPQYQFTVAPGSRLAGVRVLGRGSAPRVTLTGPSGQRITMPAHGIAARDAHSWILRNEADDSTGIALFNPQAGVWTVTRDPGSVPIRSVDHARGLPPVSIDAHVSGHGRRRTLVYSMDPLPGETVTFVERGPKLGHTIGVATGTAGRIPFTPGYGPAGQRSIEAMITVGPMPRENVTVARYQASAPPKPARPRGLALTRTGDTLTVTWRRAARAVRYDVVVTTSNGRLVESITARRSLDVHGVLPDDPVTVKVTGMDRYLARGPTATTTSGLLPARAA